MNRITKSKRKFQVEDYSIPVKLQSSIPSEQGAEEPVGEVDPSDPNIKSFLVRHHRFDPETNHFRWFVLKAFDNEGEMNQLLNEIRGDLEVRRLRGESHPKEHVAGEINDPKWERNNSGCSTERPLE